MSGAGDGGLPAALLKPVEPVAEHRLLGRLIGEWDITGEWFVMPGQPPLPVVGHMVNSAVFAGHYVESRTYFAEGLEGSRVIYGFDPDDGRFVAFAINAITARSDVEYGHYREARDELRFEGHEPVGPQRRMMRFERSIVFHADDAFDLVIYHPEFEADRQVGIALRMRRRARSA